MSIIRDKNARGGYEITGTLHDAPGRSVHRKAQPYPPSEMLENKIASLRTAALVENPKGIQPWSPAETPEGRKMMKEGDSNFHFDSGKPMIEQLPPRALMEVAKVFTYGAKKYGDHNWARYSMEWKWSQLIGSCLRHLYAWMAREDLDPESGLPHLDHAAANLLMLIELIKTGNTNDNRNPIGD